MSEYEGEVTEVRARFFECTWGYIDIYILGNGLHDYKLRFSQAYFKDPKGLCGTFVKGYYNPSTLGLAPRLEFYYKNCFTNSVEDFEIIDIIKQ